MKLRSIELCLPDPVKAVEFLTTIWGLALAANSGQTRYLRGSGRAPYIIALEESDRCFVRSVTFACSRERLTQLAKSISREDLRATPVVSEDPGGGDGLMVELPEGTIFRFLADTKEVAPIDDNDLVVGLTHVVINSRDAELCASSTENALGFKVSDRTKGLVFVRCNEFHHSTAFARAGFSSLNHIAFEMKDFDAVMRGTGRLRDHGMSPAWGPGRHGPGANIFAYFIAPFGPVIEFSTAVEKVPPDYRTGDPEDWTWPEGRIDHWGLSDKDTQALLVAEKMFQFDRDWEPAPLNSILEAI